MTISMSEYEKIYQEANRQVNLTKNVHGSRDIMFNRIFNRMVKEALLKKGMK